MEFIIKCGGWIALIVGTITAVLMLIRMKKDKGEKK